jgi:hypothetical protein
MQCLLRPDVQMKIQTKNGFLANPGNRYGQYA